MAVRAPEMSLSEYWLLLDKLTVRQSALLILGIDPSDRTTSWPAGYEPLQVAICEALKKGEIQGAIEPFFRQTSSEGDIEAEEGTVKPDSSTVVVNSLCQWLVERGHNPGILARKSSGSSPQKGSPPPYLDSSHLRYSPKLAAANAVWLAVSADPGSGIGRSVKQGMVNWLNENADEFGLRKPNGQLNNDAIEEIAKIANWDLKGGAPKTASRS
jgi:hypothetical protein